MNPPAIFYVQIGIDIVMCGLILYFLWRVGMKKRPSSADDEAARRELARLVSESQQSAQNFLDALAEGRRSLKELSYALDEKEARLRALFRQAEAVEAAALPGNGSDGSASDGVDREKVLGMKKDGASIAEIIRETGLSEGEVQLIIDLARSQIENR